MYIHKFLCLELPILGGTAHPVRDTDLHQRGESYFLQSSLAPWRTARDSVLISTSFTLGPMAMGKGLRQHSWHNTAPTF